jgi:predicted restriction endonuclease
VQYILEEYHRNIPDDELISDLIKVAKIMKKDSITADEYNSFGKYNSTTLTRRFGSWFKSLEKAGLKKTRILGVSEEEYIENLANVWEKLGRQPRYNEMVKPISKYSAGSYEYHFGTWRKSLEALVTKQSSTLKPRDKQFSKKIKARKNISWRLRFEIMKRDNFKCKLCGRSPTTDPAIILHIDHILPVSKGGKNNPENLQTCCSKCNIGKSNLNI